MKDESTSSSSGTVSLDEAGTTLVHTNSGVEVPDASAGEVDTDMVISFDIGIRHLAYCVLQRRRRPDSGTSREFSIREWNVVDLLSVAGTIYEDSCVHHLMKGWHMDTLRAWLSQRGLDTVGKRTDLLKRITSDLRRRSVSKRPNNDIGVLAVQMYHFFDSQPVMRTPAAWIIIENQPALKNPTMKSVQMVLYSYFIYHGQCRGDGSDARRVVFTSAQNKLRVYDGPPLAVESEATDDTAKARYKRAKELAIRHTRYYLDTWGVETRWHALFEGSSKKDDLSDCLLQGIHGFREFIDGVRRAPRRKKKKKVACESDDKAGEEGCTA